MQSIGSFFSGLSSSVSSAVGATGATGSSNPSKNKRWNTATGNKSPHVNYSAASGGMGAPSQKGGRCYRKNTSKKNRNRKNKTRKNRSSRNRK